ncbi:unnamed protein product, partial [Rotaria magnacalcarata]
MIATLHQLQQETQHHHRFQRQHLSELSIRQPGRLLQLNVTLVIRNFPITKYPHLAGSSSATTYISTGDTPCSNLFRVLTIMSLFCYKSFRA